MLCQYSERAVSREDLCLKALHLFSPAIEFRSMDDMVYDMIENASECPGHQCTNIPTHSSPTPRCKKHALRNRVIKCPMTAGKITWQA